MTIGDEFRKLVYKKSSSVDFLLPLLRWISGSEKNIEVSQNINYLFNYVHKDVLNRKLNLTNKVTHFITFPKIEKDNEKLAFYYKDLANYFGMTIREVKYNSNVIKDMKELIAKKYGYDNTERKILGLQKLKFK